MAEIWKDIEGFEGYYQISNFGRIRNIKIISPTKSKVDRYHFVSLSKKGVSKRCSVHRLVGKAFIPNPENKPQINHIDGDKLNNKLNNLEWMTASENQKHSYEIGTSKAKLGEDHHNSKLTEWDVRVIRKLYKNTKYWTQKKIGELFNVHQVTIFDVCNRRRWGWLK